MEALKERSTLAELAVKYSLHPNQISQWKQELQQQSEAVFEKPPKKASPDDSEQELTRLYAKIGKLEMEREFLKKSLDKLASGT